MKLFDSLNSTSRTRKFEHYIKKFTKNTKIISNNNNDNIKKGDSSE
jgi:hypothetical protein